MRVKCIKKVGFIIFRCNNNFTTTNVCLYIQDVPKKVSVKPIFEFQTLGGVFLGVKNNSKDFENKKNSRFFSKILSNWTLFSSKSSNCQARGPDHVHVNSR